MIAIRTALLTAALLAHSMVTPFAQDNSVPTDSAGRFCLGYYYVAVLGFASGRPTYTKALEPWAEMISPYLKSREGQLAMHEAMQPLLAELAGDGNTDAYLDRLAALIEQHDAACAERMNVPRFELSLVGL